MTPEDTLAESILSSRDLLLRFLVGFDDDNRTRQTADMPNHVAWTLGHCALTMHRVAERFDGRLLPEGEFVTGDGRAGDARCFDTESVCFGSTPIDAPQQYPALQRAQEIFESACARLAAAAAGAGDAKLEEMVPWATGEIALRTLVLRLAFHNGTHTGQLIDLRRALGLGRVIVP